VEGLLVWVVVFVEVVLQLVEPAAAWGVVLEAVDLAVALGPVLEAVLA
jgi:hypothetical protein